MELEGKNEYKSYILSASFSTHTRDIQRKLQISGQRLKKQLPK